MQALVPVSLVFIHCELDLDVPLAISVGGIHPRAKRIVGQRLAVAARALVYNDTSTAWTGPVFEGCSVLPDPHPSAIPDHVHNLCEGKPCGPRLALRFDAGMLGIGGDTLAVRQAGWELAIHGPPNPHSPYPTSIGARGQPFRDLAAAVRGVTFSFLCQL